MPDPIPACFRGGAAAGAPPATTAGGPNLTTSIFETPMGLASLTWSRTVLGLSLRFDLRLSDDDDDDDEPLRFRIRPWLLWKRKGARRFHREAAGRRPIDVDVAWDLASARFPAAGGPEPSSSFYVAVAVAGEMLLVAGDMDGEAHRRMKVKRRNPAMLVLKRENVVLKGDPDSGGRRSYRTSARVLGKEVEIAVEIGGKERESAGMCVAIDGSKVLQVRRLRWKFRGSERVEIGGGKVQISWDLHSWFFPNKEDDTPTTVNGSAICEIGQAVFVFHFDNQDVGKKDDAIPAQNSKDFSGGGRRDLHMGVIAGYLGKNLKLDNGGRSVCERKNGKTKKKSLLKTRSSSSSSSSSSTGSSSVMVWASPQEAELRGVDGFTLVVYAWKS